MEPSVWVELKICMMSVIAIWNELKGQYFDRASNKVLLRTKSTVLELLMRMLLLNKTAKNVHFVEFWIFTFWIFFEEISPNLQ